jgi:exo-beta-1,3-glucanase (GH17 family)
MRIFGKAFAVLLLMSVFAFSCQGKDKARKFAPAIDGQMIYNGVCYGPHRDGQRPGGAQPSSGELLEDLRLMSPHWKLIRVYGSSEFADTLLSLIEENGFDMKVMLGVWIAPEQLHDKEGDPMGKDEAAAAANRREVDAGIRLANAYPDIVAAVCVGNETQIFWSAHKVSPEIVKGYIKAVRKGVDAPVTVADDFNYWKKPESSELADEIDFITLHAHPMWNGMQVEDALGWQRERLEEIRSLHPGKQIVIGETGWATSVIDEGDQGKYIKGVPGEAEQKYFYKAVRRWAETDHEIVFFFEAFDENWKGGDNPAEVEKHWGVFRADRTPKEAMSSD